MEWTFCRGTQILKLVTLCHMFLQHGYNKWSEEVQCHESQKIESEDMQMHEQGDVQTIMWENEERDEEKIRSRGVR